MWNRDQVRGLMGSLYRKHPVGSLLAWTTKTANVAGYRFFTDLEAFKEHVRYEVLALAEPVPAA